MHTYTRARTQACHGLQQLRLHAVERGQLYGLPQLVSLHAARHQDTKAALEQFEHDIVAQAQVRRAVRDSGLVVEIVGRMPC